jgi:riboflavin-specific deaminase-like protein
MQKKHTRPHVSVNMAMSLDGKISTYRREDFAMGSEHDRRLMDVLRSKTDAVIIGAGTLRNDGFPILMRFEDLKEHRLARKLPPHPINVVLSRKLDMPVSRPFFKGTDTEKIVFTTRLAPAARVKRFQRVAEVVVLPARTLSPRDVLDVLYNRRIKRVLLEGGGEIHYAFVKEGVVDDIYITLTPKLLGGTTAPSVLDGKGFVAADHPTLRLVSSKRVGDELYLKYQVI